MERVALQHDDKVILGCAAAAGILCFFPWFSVSLAGELGEMQGLMGNASARAFDSVEGWLAFAAIGATAGLIVADKAGKLPWQRSTVLVAPLVAAGAAVLFMLIFMTRGGDVQLGGMVDSGRTLWFYTALLTMGFATFKAFQRFQAGVEVERAKSAGPTGGGEA
jgi:hypothetical protein